MKPGSPRGRAEQSAPASGRPPTDQTLPAPVRREDRACCCPAQPVVRAVMPATPERHPVDLLLCGHHYRVSRQALKAAGACIEDLPGKAEAAAAALLESPHRHHAEIR